MNIADLVTQVHGGEEEEEEELQQDATLGQAHTATAHRQIGRANGRRKRIRSQPIRYDCTTTVVVAGQRCTQRARAMHADTMACSWISLNGCLAALSLRPHLALQ